MNIEQTGLRINPCKIPTDVTAQFDSKELTHTLSKVFQLKRGHAFQQPELGKGQTIQKQQQQRVKEKNLEQGCYKILKIVNYLASK